MEQFTQDNDVFASQKPFIPPGGSPHGGLLKPFTAVDIAPPARPGTPAPLDPAVSPFLESFGGPFENAPKPAAPPEPRPRPGFHGAEPKEPEEYMPALPAAPKHSTAPVPASAPLAPPAPLDPPDPLPMASASRTPLPAAARQSRHMAVSDLTAAKVSTAKPRFFLTTTALLDGFQIQAYLDVISAEIVLPKDLLFRNPAPYGELHRLTAAEKQLQTIKAKAMEELADKAKGLHADGLVGVSVSITNLDTVCCLCTAVGTAVKLA